MSRLCVEGTRVSVEAGVQRRLLVCPVLLDVCRGHVYGVHLRSHMQQMDATPTTAVMCEPVDIYVGDNNAPLLVLMQLQTSDHNS